MYDIKKIGEFLLTEQVFSVEKKIYNFVKLIPPCYARNLKSIFEIFI